MSRGHDSDKYGMPGVVEDGNVPPTVCEDVDVFGHEDGHDIKYKTLSWQLVTVLMIAEIVSNGMLSLPSSLAVVGIVPGLILIVFLGVFATYTAYLLIQFKLRHPEVHNMGDAGMILLGPIGREVLAGGSVIFAVFATGSQMLAGEITLAALSDNKLCTLLYTGIFAIPILLCSLPRTLNSLSWFCIPACLSILIAGIVGMIGAGLHPVPHRTVSTTESPSFYSAFVSITNPVFAYAGHFIFFVLISEMQRPRDALKAAYILQAFSTTFYAIFAAILYIYTGNAVASPAFSSLPPTWSKAAYAVAIPNFLICGALCSHTAAKLFFVRIFRRSAHLHSHTVLGWAVWIGLVVVANAAAFVLAVGVPVFNYLLGLVASLFASWYTYGVAGAFWLHAEYYDGHGCAGWRRKWARCAGAVGTLLAGAFVCVAGTYVNVKGIVEAYRGGEVPGAFTC